MGGSSLGSVFQTAQVLLLLLSLNFFCKFVEHKKKKCDGSEAVYGAEKCDVHTEVLERAYDPSICEASEVSY